MTLNDLRCKPFQTWLFSFCWAEAETGRSQHSQEYRNPRRNCFLCPSWPWPLTFDPNINGLQGLVVEHFYATFGDPSCLGIWDPAFWWWWWWWWWYRVKKYRQTDRQTNAAENPIPATAVGVGYNFSWNRTWRDPSYSCRALELCRWRTICLRLRPAKHLVTACLNLPVYKDNRQIANKPMIRHDKQSLYRRHLDAPFDGCAESEPAERTGSSNVSSVQTTEDQIRYNSHKPIS